MNPLAIAVLIGWAASVAATGYFCFTAGQNSEKATQAREDRAAAVAKDAAASAIAAAIPKITVKHQTIRQELEREIQTKEVYRDPACRTGAGSLQRFNSGIPGASDAPDPSAVPASDASN